MNRKLLLSILFFVVILYGNAFGQTPNPCDDCDTIPSRYEKYYYTQWYDEVPMYGVTDSCWTERYLKEGRSGSGKCAKWEYANQPMQVKGLVALVDPYANNSYFINPYKLPEYLYLYQLTMKDSSWQGNPTPWAMTIDLQVLDSVRWDTVKPYWMPIEQGGVHPITQYIYAYECYFENPVWVDTDFYIMGTGNSNGKYYDTILDDWSYLDLYIPTWYVTFKRESIPQKGVWDEDCPSINVDPRPLWALTRGHVAFNYEGIGWHCPWSNNFFGLYLPIVDQLNIDVDVDTSIHGHVLGGGRYPIGWYDTICAIANIGYRFAYWNDGNTDNPRIIHPNGDTSFTAYFVNADYHVLQVLSSNEEWGTVTGGGYYAENQPVTIEATPTPKHLFSHWSDGCTDNPRIVYATQDTVFVAFFLEPTYVLTVTSSNEELGTVDGGGVYQHGDTAMITATSIGYSLFDSWNDGNWENPRGVVMSKDTFFTAIFIDLSSIEKYQDIKFSITPNPASGSIIVNTVECGRYNADIYDGKGRKIKTICFDNSSTEIGISTLPNGYYYLRLSKDGISGVRTFVKK